MKREHKEVEIERSDNDVGKNAKVVENLMAQRCFSFDVPYIVQTVINLDGGQIV